jgi:hypothetical protein
MYRIKCWTGGRPTPRRAQSAMLEPCDPCSSLNVPCDFSSNDSPEELESDYTGSITQERRRRGPFPRCVRFIINAGNFDVSSYLLQLSGHDQITANPLESDRSNLSEEGIDESALTPMPLSLPTYGQSLVDVSMLGHEAFSQLRAELPRVDDPVLSSPQLIAPAMASGLSEVRQDPFALITHREDRTVFDRIIDLFFQWLYPIFPLPHRPSTEHDLRSRRELRHQEHEWTTMIIGILGFATAHLSHTMMGITMAERRSIFHSCLCHVRSHVLGVNYTKPSLNRRESQKGLLALIR